MIPTTQAGFPQEHCLRSVAGTARTIIKPSRAAEHDASLGESEAAT